MKSQLNWNDATDSRITTSQSFRKPQLSTKLSALWQGIATYLNSSSEPRVWQTHEAGEMAWSAYDPITRTSIEQVSAQELRVWLEERHYQSA